MIRFMKALKPTQIEDIIAGISLYRPGPMDSIPTYIKNKNNPAGIRYVTPELKPILDVTHGCLVYQEQVMEIVRKLGGYSYGRSDLVRRAMSKKKMDVMKKERQHFVYGLDDEQGNVVIAGCVRNGISAEAAEAIYDDMLDFAKYAFNKSHAAGYAIIAYQTAYLKARYPLAFMAACMTASMGSHKKIAQYIKACRDMKIEVLAPDVNRSEGTFSVEDGAVRFGLYAIKHVGKSIVANIVEERRTAEFKNFEDFLNRLAARELNKKAIESLIKAGALDSFGELRSVLLLNYERLIDSIQQNRRHNAAGQLSLFDEIEELEKPTFNYAQANPLSRANRLNFEREVIGVYVSGHPLEDYRAVIDRVSTISSAELVESGEQGDVSLDGKRHQMAGLITRVVEKGTKKGDKMAFITLEDFYGEIEVVVFSRILHSYRPHIARDKVVVITGSVSIKEDESASLIADVVKPLDGAIAARESAAPYDYRAVKLIYLRVKALTADHQQFLAGLSQRHRGSSQIKIYQSDADKVVVYKRGVSIKAPLIDEIKQYFGDDNVRLIDK
ncbi:MAG: hypothetical protein CSB19_01190 [Clostridiales bacterium]|nr:MAG: hypothetical protein CSB19_01190 [Clostridiales bacterium]